MTVYVDDYRANFRGMIMSHMIADTEAELDEMAQRIGLNLKWKQLGKGKRRSHYDVSESKRLLAISYGAVAVSVLRLGRILADLKY